MATFPALEPIRREWEFPAYPTVEYTGIGVPLAFELGQVPSEQPLTLVYTLLSDSEAYQVQQHYLGQQTIYPFALDLLCYAGYAQAQNVFDFATEWRYTDQPELKLRTVGRYDLEIPLRTFRS